MKLPFLSSKQHTDSEHVFGLFLKEDCIVGFIFELRNKTAVILAQEEMPLSNGWQAVVEDTDALLFKLENQTKKHVQKAIFFVYTYAVDIRSKEIKKQYKDIIKNIVKQLELQPLGFIECHEAVEALLVKKYHSPVNAVLVELDTTHVSVCVYKSGQLVHAQTVLRTDMLAEDLTEVFHTLPKTVVLPSRIVLYPSLHSRKQVSHLMTHRWSEDIFIQLPRIEVIKEEDLYEGLASIFGEQMQAQEKSDVRSQTLEMEDVEQNQEVASQKSEESEEEREMSKEQEEERLEIRDQRLEDEVPAQAAEVMGFKIGEDVSEGAQPQFSPTTEKKKKKFALSIPHFSFSVKKGKLPYLIGAVVLVILLLLTSIEYAFHKTTLVVLLPSQEIQKQADLTGDDVGVKSGTVSAQITDSVKTSGQRDVGDKAHGSVTVYNFDDKDHVFAKGTTLSVAGHTYTLDDEVKVASASDQLSNGSYIKQPGKVQADITATVIGPESNVDKNQKFQIDNLSTSTYFAANDAAIGGGSKKQVTTVAKKDMDDLKAKVLAQGKTQGLDEIQKQTNSEQQLIDSLTTQTISDSHFSKEVGEQADQLTLQANVVTTYYSYTVNDMKKFAQGLVSKDAPDGYTVPENTINVTISKATQKGQAIQLSTDIKAKAVKEIPKDEVLQAVKGKKKSSLDDIIKQQLHAAGYVIDDHPHLFFPFSLWMPFFKKNIEIQVNSV